PLAGSHGHHDATTDHALITAWWTVSPTANIARRLDPFHPVLDTDPRHDGDATLRQLEQQYGSLPDTMRALSGRGDKGTHYYFTSPVPIPHKVFLGTGIDVLSDGYVILPPSIHPVSGKPHLWDVGPDEDSLDALPDWLIDLCLAGGTQDPDAPLLE